MSVSDSYRALTRLSNAELERIFQASSGPAPEALAGFEWRGFNVPWWAKVLGFQKFIKGMFRAGDRVEGYNVSPRQNGIDADWIHRPSPEKPFRFGWFTAKKTEGNSEETLYPKATLLNYGESRRNFCLQPMKALRDYVVQPDPKNPDVLVGKAYVALGPLRVFSNFFIIEKLNSAAWKP